MKGLKLFWADKTAFIGAVVLIIMLLVSLLAKYLMTADPNAISLGNMLAEPSISGAILGTDQLGRDLLIRIVYGTRTTFLVSVAALLIAGVLGVALGLLAGYFKGVVEKLVLWVLDIQLSMPILLLTMVIVFMLEASSKTVILALGFSGWMEFARITRGGVLALKGEEFIEAAESIGASKMRIMTRHLLPNLASQIVTIGILVWARFILAESSLSFLGFGSQPPTISLGLLLAVGRDYIATAWWLVTFPGLNVFIMVLCLTLVGNRLKRVWDPVTRRKLSTR